MDNPYKCLTLRAMLVSRTNLGHFGPRSRTTACVAGRTEWAGWADDVSG